MQFNKMIKEIKAINFEEIRNEAENYFEGVVLHSELPELIIALEKFFGLPAYPSEKVLAPEAEAIVDNFGGVRSNQTLYFMNKEGEKMFAMLWPWSDEEHTTIKIGKNQ
ncbi:MAG: hypothetical protein ABIG56_04145 [Candidatus Omnitrophota bacterium]